MRGHSPDSPLRNLRVTLEYDGTAYFGWQAQRGGGTVQQKLVAAIAAVTSEVAIVYAAGRTDAGVHAMGQVANFRTRSRIPADRFPFALNAHLPRDIVVLACEEASPDFHAQFHARGKLYRYRILHRGVPSALDWNRCWWIHTPLDLDRMRAAAAHLVGKQDFKALGTQTGKKKSTVREITSLDIVQEGDSVLFDVAGTGFLYNMVRTIVGTLWWVGKGALSPEALPEILQSRDRRRAGPVAPAQGLYLMRVFYETATPSERKEATWTSR
ncbi:MAG: tRNA pseudouridine(38-40) synthase TruA [Planctomycetes bacterium]|nr:tRNA pseudouridine(38-40) synthase TruA [Planctomycetota bacterium]